MPPFRSNRRAIRTVSKRSGDADHLTGNQRARLQVSRTNLGHIEATFSTSSCGGVWEWPSRATSDEIRREFMRLGNHSTWADKDMPWNHRRVEGAAFAIQQGLAGPAMPPGLSPKHEIRVDAFELPTGRPAPRLVEWCAEQATNLPSVPDGLC